MAIPWVSQESALARARVALRETGVAGLTRRTARQALLKVRDRASALAVRLFYIEAARRLPERERKLSARSRELEGSRRGEPAFVFGTGPSLARYDLSPLANDVTIGVNAFFRHPVMSVWQPTFYVLMDNAFFDDPGSNRPFFDELLPVTQKTKFLIPAVDEPSCRGNGYLPPERTYYFSMDGSLEDGGVQTLDFAGLLPGLLNSVQLGIGLAIYLGCSPIYVLGADHDWLARRIPRNVLPEDPHFYAGPTMARPPKKTDADPFASYTVLIEYSRKLWRSYEVLQEIAARNGQEIMVSHESYLDVLTPFDYDELIRSRAKASKGG